MTGALVWLLITLLPPASVRPPSGHFAPRFRIGKDTTYITEPIDAEGYPDYEEAINRRSSKGVDPQENRVVALLKAIGPCPPGSEPLPWRYYDLLGVPPPPSGEDYLISFDGFLQKETTLTKNERLDISNDWPLLCSKRPWRKENHAHLASWIERNRQPLETALQACRKSHYFFPMVDPDKENPSAGLRRAKSMPAYEIEVFLSLLRCRAMQEIHNSEFPAARQTLLSAMSLIHSIQPNCSKDLARLLHWESDLYESLHGLLSHAPFSRSELDSLERQLSALPPFPRLIDLVDQADRLVLLNEILTANKFGYSKIEHLISYHFTSSAPRQSDLIRSITNAANYTELLRFSNQCIDNVISDLKIPDDQARRKAVKQTVDRYSRENRKVSMDLDKDSKPWWQQPFAPRISANLIGLEVAHWALVDIRLAQEASDQAEEAKRLFFTSLALAKFRSDSGKYPDSLKDLVPKYLKDVSRDLYSGGNPCYRKTPEGGFVLYSVGKNGIDSGGRDEWEDVSSDDIVFKVPLPPFTYRSSHLSK